MKEFSAQTGGRYTYVDDVINLQELSLAFSEIFNGCDNFIVSGCRVSGNSISDGYVYINRKIRYFSGVSDVKNFPYYIYESNRFETVPYASGGTKVGRHIYSCVGANAVPSSIDPITKLTPSSIEVNENGSLTIKDAFFGKYALLLDPEKKQQSVRGNVDLSGSISIKEKATVNDITIGNQSNKLHSYAEKDAVVIDTNVLGSQYKLRFSQNNLTLSINDEDVFIASDKECVFTRVVSTQAKVGAIVLNNNTISRESPGSIDINVSNKNGSKAITRIGNGSGKILLEIDGNNNRVSISGTTIIDKSEINLVSDVSNCVFKDSGELIGSFGKNKSNCVELIINRPIKILSSEYVDISNIKENGMSLSAKYLQTKTFKDEIKKIAYKDKTYDKEHIDKYIATKAGGLSQFILEPVIREKDPSNDLGLSAMYEVTKKTLRKQIGAIGNEDLNSYVKVSEHLSDMVKKESDKKIIRKNIGAVGFDECQKKLKDTGWILLTNDLYIRQIGNIVQIQGTHRYLSKGVFEYTIPAEIDQPIHGVNGRFTDIETHGWISIKGGQRKIVICGTSKRYHPIEIGLTYMV